MNSATPKFLIEHVDVIVVRPLRILLIVVVALVFRAVVRRAIKRLTVRPVETDVPLVLRPLAERVDVDGLLENAGLLSERRRQREVTVGSVLGNIASVAIFAVATMLILAELEVNLAPIVASAGILGVAVGFGAQNLVKDIVSGIFMILEDQYGVGDVIDLGEAIGTVEGVGLRTTRLRDVYGTVWYVRNGEIIRVGNQSQGYAQVVLDTPVRDGADIHAAGVAIKQAADALWRDPDWSDVVLEEPQLLGIEQVTDEGVLLRLTMKTRPLQQWRVGRELRARVRDRLDASAVTRSQPDGELHVPAGPTGSVETAPAPPEADRRT